MLVIRAIQWQEMSVAALRRNVRTGLDEDSLSPAEALLRSAGEVFCDKYVGVALIKKLTKNNRFEAPNVQVQT